MYYVTFIGHSFFVMAFSLWLRSTRSISLNVLGDSLIRLVWKPVVSEPLLESTQRLRYMVWQCTSSNTCS